VQDPAITNAHHGHAKRIDLMGIRKTNTPIVKQQPMTKSRPISIDSQEMSLIQVIERKGNTKI
jgi:hypothetical protein